MPLCCWRIYNINPLKHILDMTQGWHREIILQGFYLTLHRGLAAMDNAHSRAVCGGRGADSVGLLAVVRAEISEGSCRGRFRIAAITAQSGRLLHAPLAWPQGAGGLLCAGASPGGRGLTSTLVADPLHPAGSSGGRSAPAPCCREVGGGTSGAEPLLSLPAPESGQCN